MKNRFLFFLTLLLCFDVSAQNNTPIGYYEVEQKPTFNGGTINDFEKWATAQTNYPKGLTPRTQTSFGETKEIGHTVLLNVIIGTDGRITPVDCEWCSCEPKYEEFLVKEAKRLAISSSPLWEPGRQDGKSVKVKAMLSIMFFSPQNAQKSSSSSSTSSTTKASSTQLSSTQRNVVVESGGAKATATTWVSSSGKWIFKLYRDETADIQLGDIASYHTTWTEEGGRIFIGGVGVTKAFILTQAGDVYTLSRTGVIEKTDGIKMHKQ